MSSSAVAAGAAIGVFVLLALISTALWLVRRRRQQTSEPPSDDRIASFRRNTFVALNHPASRVTPFNSPGRDIPRFVNQPGENMRVAHRRSDGGWEFSDVIPDNRSTIDFLSSTTHSPRPSLSSRTTLNLSHKGKLLPGELTTRGYIERNSEDQPPPAYEPDSRSVSDV